MAKYRKLYPRLWPQLAELPDGERVMALYVIGGPQTNRIGLFPFLTGTASDQLHRPVATIKRQFKAVCALFGWRYDAKARVVWIPSWWIWNQPENANVLKGCLADLDELPATDLLAAFASHDGTLKQTLRQTFRDEMARRSGKPSPIQEQEQEQEQEQDLNVPPASPPPARPDQADDGRPERVYDRLVTLARQHRGESLPLTIRPADFPKLAEVLARYPDDAFLDAVMLDYVRSSDKDIRKNPVTVGWFAHWAGKCEARVRGVSSGGTTGAATAVQYDRVMQGLPARGIPA